MKPGQVLTVVLGIETASSVKVTFPNPRKAVSEVDINQSISVLNLSNRPRTYLMNAGLETIRDVLVKHQELIKNRTNGSTSYGLLYLRNFGRKSFYEVRDRLREQGVKLDITWKLARDSTFEPDTAPDDV